MNGPDSKCYEISLQWEREIDWQYQINLYNESELGAHSWKVNRFCLGMEAGGFESN